MLKRFHLIVKISIVCIYLIIIAGSVVRMTGSGMGCPDWPKCFGYYIPPTQESEIQFQANHKYKTGHVIKVEDYFYYAKEDFTSSEALNMNNWEKNTKHEYNTFDVTHTWIEYINRLFTALAGIPILIMFIFSFFFIRKKIALWIASTVTIFGMGFEAWLGKTVVDSNLLPYKITFHMFGSFVIIASLIYLLYKSKEHLTLTIPKKVKLGLILALLLTLIQVAIGTQVRQFVDEKVIAFGYNKATWLQDPTFNFYFHRTFSIAVLALNLWLFLLNKKLSLGLNQMRFVMYLLGLEIITGIAMSYFEFPFASQPLHLLLATLLFGVQLYLIMKAFKK
ncbi:MAG: COX15/CtaA family protein [Flavobacteriaceae bacterium]|nr:COX15/CtaA family protein [Flavobacteriaceae bacterium]